MENNNLKILFFGDVVGRIGRNAAADYLTENRSKYDFIIMNAENASHGFGLTQKNYNQLSEAGVHCFTSGNHIWDKKEIFNYIDSADKLIRPMNYPEGTRGVGYRIFDVGEYKICVMNFLGRVFMQPFDSQWKLLEDNIQAIKEITPIVFIDFHAEATAEKICFAKFCSSFGVSAFVGTHTHVQTADETIMNGMAYITDAGFCGAEDGVIGMEYSTSLTRMTTCLPERFEVAQDNVAIINAVEITINPLTGKATDIKRIKEKVIYEKNEEVNLDKEKS
ncbi:YmdB family metallophosphoesterase [bacterium]|nr:YmdB family metallophosphoesterase [bacterium]